MRIYRENEIKKKVNTHHCSTSCAYTYLVQMKKSNCTMFNIYLRGFSRPTAKQGQHPIKTKKKRLENYILQQSKACDYFCISCSYIAILSTLRMCSSFSQTTDTYREGDHRGQWVDGYFVIIFPTSVQIINGRRTSLRTIEEKKQTQ